MQQISLSLLSLFSITTFNCFAEITEYDISVVIFEDISNRYVNSEQWPRLEHLLSAEQQDIAVANNKITETAYPDGNDVINISDSDTKILDEYTKDLNASSRYNVLVHKSWRQTGLDEKSAVNIHINSETEPANDSTVALTDFNSPHSETSASSVSGEIKVTLGRYLHIYTDLIYKKPGTSYSPVLTPSNNAQLKEFSIKSHRRMRSKELHYIDHPLVGMLVMALPVEKQEEEQEKNTAQ